MNLPALSIVVMILLTTFKLLGWISISWLIVFIPLFIWIGLLGFILLIYFKYVNSKKLFDIFNYKRLKSLFKSNRNF